MATIYFLKPVPDSDGDYHVSDTGEVFSMKSGKYIELKCNQSINGYLTVTLHFKNRPLDRKENARNSYMYQVHRLVASAWLENPQNYPVVNHKDGNKQNNHVDNLEWVTYSENSLHAINVLKNSKYVRSVIQCTLNGKFVAKFKSIKEAEEITKISRKSICLVCQGKRRKAGDYAWFYEENYVEGKGMRKLAQCKKVAQYTKDGKFVKEYESMRDAAVAVGAQNTNISHACSGKLQTSKGYIWKYVEKEEAIDETKGWATLKKFPYDRISKDGRIFSTWGKRMKIQVDRKRYKLVSMTDSNGRETKLGVHRLVALAYIPNPKKYPMVNHKDGDPSNNHVNNLEWCSASQNAQHAHDNGLCSSKKRVAQVKNGKIIARYESMRHAAEAIGLSASAISHVCRKDTGLKTAGGYEWIYV